MNDLSPKNNRKFFLEKFGQELGGFGTDGEDQSIVNYLDGLTQFDEFLGGLPFENTNCSHNVFAHENGILLLLLSPKVGSVSINIWKDEIESVTGYHNQSIKIPRKNAIVNLMKSGAAGLLWTGVGYLSDNIINA